MLQKRDYHFLTIFILSLSLTNSSDGKRNFLRETTARMIYQTNSAMAINRDISGVFGKFLIRDLNSPNEKIKSRELDSMLDDEDTRIMIETEKLMDVFNKTQQAINKTKDIYNKTSNTVKDINETLNTAPTAWDKSQWVIVGVIIFVCMIIFGCLWRCIPCAPRLI